MTPVAANAASCGFQRNAPSRIRNSPTKPFMPGSAIDDSVMIRNAATSRGMTAFEPAELGDQARVAAVREHADDHEERAGADAVVQHLVDRALQPSSREQAEHDEPEVADARVRDQLLHVGLDHRDERAVDDADHGEHGNATARSTAPPSGNSGKAKRSRP